MILGAIADGIHLANQAVQATGAAIQVGAAELVRQERMFWGLDPNPTDPVTQAKQDAALRETAWGQTLGPNVPIEVLRSIDRLPTDEDKLLVAQLLKGRHETGIAGSGFEPGAIDLTDQPEKVLEAVLKEVKNLRDEVELYRFAAGDNGVASSAAAQGLQRAADVLEQFAALYANGGEPLPAPAEFGGEGQNQIGPISSLTTRTSFGRRSRSLNVWSPIECFVTLCKMDRGHLRG